jgi:hypothetical protein
VRAPAFRYALLCTALLLAACGVLRPVSHAQTTEQKAWALYGEFVVYQEQGAALVQDPAVPAEVKAAIRAADQAAHPVAEALYQATRAVSETRRMAAQGALSAEELAAAQAKLASTYADAVGALSNLINLVKGR